MAQDPPEHDAVPPVELHCLPQPPQLFASLFVSISQPFHALPSQSLNRGLGLHETIEQPEFEHLSVAWFVLHAAPQDPQLDVSFVVFAHRAPSPEPQSFGRSPGQDWPQTGGVPLHVAEPLLGAGHKAQVVPHELVDVELSGVQVPLQLW
jgi:hypothetical protein